MANYVENIVIGKPHCEEWLMFANNIEHWNWVEQEKTFYTNERFLPKILVEIGIVPSISEVKRNKPQLMISLDNLDYIEIKWGKKNLFILVGK